MENKASGKAPMSMQDFQNLLAENRGVLFYFYSESCGVCQVLFPKISALMESEFPQMEFIPLSADDQREVAYQLRMASVPGIIGFLEGKEFFRSNGLISLAEFHHRISRPYSFFFEN
ncbi:thioredoxin family protein [Lunatimonas salinarum]|uniref:thioredoxin family protein n=1 Tax=Lunatimonas salinarum TaxID=1774590 RepID=UPI001FD753E7|nr:thioredoxin family protein [Lunatimonas salinarum]